VEKVKEKKKQIQPPHLRALVWDCLGVTTTRASVVDRIGTKKSGRTLNYMLVFTRLGPSK